MGKGNVVVGIETWSVQYAGNECRSVSLTITLSSVLPIVPPKLPNRDDRASDWTSIAVLAGLRLEIIPSSWRACTSFRIWAGVYLLDGDEDDDDLQQLPRRTWSSMSK